MKTTHYLAQVKFEASLGDIENVFYHLSMVLYCYQLYSPVVI
jgi:hypothetical protein